MDAPGTETLARELGYDYVYYPSALHPRTHRDFGNAVLSRWPIQSDHKLVLPHLSGLRRMARAVTAADLRLPAGLVRVYSVHLATPAELLPQARVDQALAIAEDARGFPGAVIVAGDFNNRDLVVRVFENADFTWIDARPRRHAALLLLGPRVRARPRGPAAQGPRHRRRQQRRERPPSRLGRPAAARAAARLRPGGPDRRPLKARTRRRHGCHNLFRPGANASPNARLTLPALASERDRPTDGPHLRRGGGLDRTPRARGGCRSGCRRSASSPR